MSYAKYRSIIISHLSTNTRATIVELADICNITKPTIRRYLHLLEKENIIKCTYGGAEFLFPSHFSTLKLRMNENAETKQNIARKASEFIKDGDTIFLGGGSTVAYMAQYLSHKKNLVVVTNSLYIINELSYSQNIRLICAGGILYPNNNSFVGDFTAHVLQNCIVDKVFLGAAGISHQGVSYRPSTTFDQEVLNESLILQQNSLHFFLADSDKFKKKGAVITTPPSQIHSIITDLKFSQNDLSIWKDLQIRIINI
ncbi:MAG: DeoR/GlpR family DNA-binding transcription regulator [Brevinema sp.]